MSDLEPCKTCPWRKSSTVGGGDIPGFSLDKMRNLQCTVGPDDAMRQIMACHYSPEGKESACRGYVAKHGYSNLNVRMLAARGVIPIRQIIDACVGIDLWNSFDEMLEAYEEAQCQSEGTGRFECDVRSSKKSTAMTARKNKRKRTRGNTPSVKKRKLSKTTGT